MIQQAAPQVQSAANTFVLLHLGFALCLIISPSFCAAASITYTQHQPSNHQASSLLSSTSPTSTKRNRMNMRGPSILFVTLVMGIMALCLQVEGLALRRHRGAAPSSSANATQQPASNATTTTNATVEQHAQQHEQSPIKGGQSNQTQSAVPSPKGEGEENIEPPTPPDNHDDDQPPKGNQQQQVPLKEQQQHNEGGDEEKPQSPHMGAASAATATASTPDPPKESKTVATPPNASKKVGRISVPHSDLTLSRIAYGSLHFPEFKDDTAGLKKSIDKCLEMGITTLDLSDVYGWYGNDGHGKANDIFAKVLKENPDLRSKLELVAKFGIRLQGGYHVDLSPQWINECMDRYLDQFGIDYVDVFMIHNPDPNMDAKAVAKTFREIKDANKTRTFGISNFHIWEYQSLKDAMAAEGLKLSVHEMETSVLHPDKISDGTVDFFCKGEDELRILGWGPLGGEPSGGKNLLFGSDGWREKRIVGALTDKGKTLALEETGEDGKVERTTFQPDEVAVAWLLHHPSNIVPIIGTTTAQRIASQSVPAEKIPFKDTDWNDIMDQCHY